MQFEELSDSQRCSDTGALRDFYRNRPVLVTGANGFLGVNAVHALEALGARVTVLVRQERVRAQGFSGRVIQGDLRFGETVRTAVAGQSIVFDFAGVSGAVASNQDPDGFLDRECGPHLQLIKACAEATPSPVVTFCSSRLVYGRPRYLPVDENHPLCPQSMYAVHKITIEHYLHVFATTHGLRFVVLRVSNPYGPYQPRDPRNYGVINRFIRDAADGRPIRVFGEGRQKRDYIHVADVVTAFLAAAMTDACHGHVFNFGGRRAVSIAEAAHTIARLAGGTPVCFEPWPGEYQSVETGDYQSDLRKIDRYIALPPPVPLEDGLRQTLFYYRNSED